MARNAAKPIEALARGLRILEVLSRTTGSMSNGQISRATELAPSTVSRLTDSLVQLGYLRVDQDSGAYQLTPKNLRLGYPILANLPLGSRPDRALEALQDNTAMTAAIAIRDGLHMTFVAVSRARRPGAIPLAAGGRIPIGTSAAGIAYLQAMPDPGRERLASQVRRDLQQRGIPTAEFDKLTARPADKAVISQGKWNKSYSGVARTLINGGKLYSMTVVARTEELYSQESVDKVEVALDSAIAASMD